MALALQVDGSVYNYPENEDENWGNQATQWAQAVTNVIAFLRSPTAPLADSGQIRMGNADSIEFRNVADSGNLKLYTNGQDKLFFNDGVTDFDLTSTAAGDVNGPGSSTDNALVRWDLASGTIVQDSGVLLDDSNNLTGIAALTAATLTATTSATTVALTATGDVTLSGTGTHTISAEVANAVRDAQTRTISATAGLGEIARVIADQNVTAAASAPGTLVATVTITVSGDRPVRIATIGQDGGALSRIINNDAGTGTIGVYRDSTSTLVGQQYFDEGAGLQTIPAGTVEVWDTPSAGTYDYLLYIACSQTPGNATGFGFFDCYFVAYEI